MVPKKDFEVSLERMEIGPVVHATLPETLVERILSLAQIFSEVEHSPQSKWVEDFQRDQNPELEISRWEVMAGTYLLFTQDRELDLPAKREVFAVILLRSMHDTRTVLQKVELCCLSGKDARRILTLMEVVAGTKRIKI